MRPPFKYRHSGVTKNQFGEKALASWVYQPSEPTPSSAPVILFLHGWNGTDPYYYGGWIDHLVKSGNIVIYPVYQDSPWDSPEEMVTNAIQATREAISRLKILGPIRPEPGEFAIIGHSLGGGLGLLTAGRSGKVGLPTPRALMLVQPGLKGSDHLPTEELEEIPSSVLMLIIDGDEDQFEKTRLSNGVYCDTAQIPPDHKAYLVLQSDRNSNPPLIADHSSPLSPRESYRTENSTAIRLRRKLVTPLIGMREGEEDALDYFGYWPLFDSLFDAALGGKRIDDVIGAAKHGYVLTRNPTCSKQ